MEYRLRDLEEKYELELERIIAEIGKSGAKSVLLQLPDGLKPWGPVLVDYIEERCSFSPKSKVGSPSEVSVMIWLGDCFGACDLPDSECDLVVQFGHAEW